MTRFNASDVLVKPVYDVAYYGNDIILPLSTDTLTLQSITWSQLNELLRITPDNADTHLEDYPRLVSSEDTLGIMHEGDGVRYNRTFEFLSDMSAWVYKFVINICVALDVTAYTSGAHSVDSVQFVITERLPDGTLVKEIANQTIETGMTDIGGVQTKACVVQFEGNKPFKVSQGNIVRIQIAFNSTDTLVATSFEGIMPYFYFQEGSLAKALTESAIIMHLHPAIDHAFPVFRDQSRQTKLDYDGIDINGELRT